MTSDLIGLRLESCRFTMCSLTFEFEGKCAGEGLTYFVSIGGEIEFSPEGLAQALKGQERPLSQSLTRIWEFLELPLQDIREYPQEHYCEFVFENGMSFWVIDTYDNVAIVTRKNSQEWWTIC